MYWKMFLHRKFTTETSDENAFSWNVNKTKKPLYLCATPAMNATKHTKILELSTQ